MTTRSNAGFVALILTSALCLGSARPDPRTPTDAAQPPQAVGCTAGVALLGWMTGEWSHADESGAWEERWSPPMGGCMVGSLRWVREGKPALYEMLALEEDDQGHVRMFVRHFGPGLEPWKSERGGPTPTWVLTSVERGHAVFEDPARSFPSKITYTADFNGARTTALRVRLEGVENDAPRVIEFEFSPISP